MNLTCIIFSGLPGTGKTTLARLLSRELHLPLIQLDAVVEIIPSHMLQRAEPFWDDMMHIVMQLAAAQLANGLSVVVDAVFMGPDRAQMQELALCHGALWRPIHTCVSDEAVWRQRVEQRCAEQPEDEPATWERIGQQRLAFEPWLPEQALFLDTLAPLADNIARIHVYLRDGGDETSSVESSKGPSREGGTVWLSPPVLLATSRLLTLLKHRWLRWGGWACVPRPASRRTESASRSFPTSAACRRSGRSTPTAACPSS